jgi:activator of 2-hydroxyglutaryl-CoA dehydratase
MTNKKYMLGIDIGSTTVKIAVLDAQRQLLFSDYERHFADIQGALA